MLDGIIMTLMLIVAVFLILLVLVQRGRGGGLTGALGGMGGQSAFGTKAGDLFTRITIGTAAVWIVLCIWAVKNFNQVDRFDPGIGVAEPAAKMPFSPAGSEPVSKPAAPSGESKETTSEPSAPSSTESAAPESSPTPSDKP